MELAKPYNLLMPFRGHKLSVEVLAHSSGELPSQLEKDAAPVPLPATRLYTRRLDKPSRMSYVDVTTKQVQAMLDGFLRLGTIGGKAITFRSRGQGPNRRDSIHIRPIGGSLRD